MDARTRKRQMTETVSNAHALAEAFTAKRDRLLAALTLIAGVGLIVGRVPDRLARTFAARRRTTCGRVSASPG